MSSPVLEFCEVPVFYLVDILAAIHCPAETSNDDGRLVWGDNCIRLQNAIDTDHIIRSGHRDGFDWSRWERLLWCEGFIGRATAHHLSLYYDRGPLPQFVQRLRTLDSIRMHFGLANRFLLRYRDRSVRTTGKPRCCEQAGAETTADCERRKAMGTSRCQTRASDVRRS